jgi:hypothetical protein
MALPQSIPNPAPSFRSTKRNDGAERVYAAPQALAHKALSTASHNSPTVKARTRGVDLASNSGGKSSNPSE